MTRMLWPTLILKVVCVVNIPPLPWPSQIPSVLTNMSCRSPDQHPLILCILRCPLQDFRNRWHCPHIAIVVAALLRKPLLEEARVLQADYGFPRMLLMECVYYLCRLYAVFHGVCYCLRSNRAVWACVRVGVTYPKHRREEIEVLLTS